MKEVLRGFEETLVEAIRVAYLTGHGTGFQHGQENTEYSSKEAEEAYQIDKKEIMERIDEL